MPVASDLLEVVGAKPAEKDIVGWSPALDTRDAQNYAAIRTRATAEELTTAEPIDLDGEVFAWLETQGARGWCALHSVSRHQHATAAQPLSQSPGCAPSRRGRRARHGHQGTCDDGLYFICESRVASAPCCSAA
jgi:hypothetical protein